MPDSATTSYGHAWLVGPASRWCSLLLLTIALDLAPGCGQPQAQQGPAERPAQTADVPLPDWAPKNPSPEFLRALSVLKPIPLEELTRGGGSGPAAEAQALRHRLMWPAAYEFFGTLSDEQIQRFLSSREEEKKILIPMQSLTPKQRRAFDTWV
ncbi:MAG: hypothetical protein JSV79_03860, partial [Armatimonadota bacterium]